MGWFRRKPKRVAGHWLASDDTLNVGSISLTIHADDFSLLRNVHLGDRIQVSAVYEVGPEAVGIEALHVTLNGLEI